MTCNAARFNTQDQAMYVAACLSYEMGGRWEVVQCDSHWHVLEMPVGLRIEERLR